MTDTLEQTGLSCFNVRPAMLFLAASVSDPTLLTCRPPLAEPCTGAAALAGRKGKTQKTGNFLVVARGGYATVPIGYMPGKEGKTIVKFVKIAAVVAFAAAALGLGACASKPKPAPAPSSVGMSK